MLFVSFYKMRKFFLESSCTAIQIDTSFDFDTSKYNVCAFCYLNVTTNKGELCASAFLAQERATIFRSAFQCDCTFHCQNQSPCRHILFKRQQADLPSFELSLFHTRYHKNGDHSSPPPPVFRPELQPEECFDTVPVLSSRQKYNMVFPVCHSLASLIAHHGTNQFHEYLLPMKCVEEMERRGGKLQYPTEQETIVQEMQDHQEPVPQEEAEEGSVSQNIFPSVSPPHDDNENSRFADLKFKNKVKARGRPKRSVRQLVSFNKSVADRGSEIQQKKQRKQKNTESLDRRSHAKKKKICDQKCPASDMPLNPGDVDIITTACCSTLIHDDYFVEFEMYPDCDK